MFNKYPSQQSIIFIYSDVYTIHNGIYLLREEGIYIIIEDNSKASLNTDQALACRPLSPHFHYDLRQSFFKLHQRTLSIGYCSTTTAIQEVAPTSWVDEDKIPINTMGFFSIDTLLYSPLFGNFLTGLLQHWPTNQSIIYHLSSRYTCITSIPLLWRDIVFGN